MPNFDRDALRKGSKAIEEALESRRSGGDFRPFRPFLPNIYWKDDKDSRYLLFLNPLEEIPEVDLHPYIDCDDGVPHQAIARTDKAIGESSDPIREQWGYKPRLTCLAVAAELEPVTEIVNGRKKPVGFEVATRTFDRKVRDDEGNDTGETEEVTVPVVGLVAQSPYNFFNQLQSYDATEGPIHTTPLKVTRLGKKENVTYNVVGYDMIEPDLTNLVEYIDNMSYVTEPEDVIAAIEAAGDDLEQATIAIGDYLLYRRIDELADEEQYNEILGNITKRAKFAEETDEKSSRKSKPSQRRSVQSGGDNAEEVEEAPAPKARRKTAAGSEETQADARINKLRQRSNRASSAKTKPSE